MTSTREVVEDSADDLGGGDGAEHAHAAAALRALEDVDAKRAAHELGPRPVAGRWGLESRVTELTDLLEQRTERSALTFRRRAGPALLTPMKPDIGTAYYQPSCKAEAPNLLAGEGAGGGSPLLRWRSIAMAEYCDGGAGGNRTRVRETSSLPSFTCVVALTLATGLVEFGLRPILVCFRWRYSRLLATPSPVVDTLGVLGRPSRRMLTDQAARATALSFATNTSRFVRRTGTADTQTNVPPHVEADRPQEGKPQFSTPAFRKGRT